MPSAYLAIIKDVLIIVAIAVLGWWVFHSGEDRVRVKDLRAVQTQLGNMQVEEQRWQQEQTNAQQKLASDLPAINNLADTTASEHIWLCDNRPQQPVSRAAPAPAPVPNPGVGGTQSGPRRDIAPAIAAFKRKYETALSECRSALAAWPH